MRDDGIEVVCVTLLSPSLPLEEGVHVEPSQGKLDVATNLAGDIRVKPEPLEVDA